MQSCRNFAFNITGTAIVEKSDSFILVFPVCGWLTREEQN